MEYVKRDRNCPPLTCSKCGFEKDIVSSIAAHLSEKRKRAGYRRKKERKRHVRWEAKEEIGEREERSRRSPGTETWGLTWRRRIFAFLRQFSLSRSSTSPEVEEVSQRALFPPIRRSLPSYPVLAIADFAFRMESGRSNSELLLN